jgi:homeobox protein cut-like
LDKHFCSSLCCIVQVAELAHTASSLREELKLKDEAATEDRRALQAKVVALEQENAKIKASLSDLEAQLAAAPSQGLLSSMKRELRILKRLEYNADEVDAPEDPEMTGAGISVDGDDKDLESVLVEKLRKTESDLVKERNSKLEQSKECDRLKAEMEAANKARQAAEMLVHTLENDLERAISAPALTESPGKVKRATSLQLPSSEEEAQTLNSILDPDAPPPPPVARQASQVSQSASDKADDDHSVATIVMAQRDRLRARCEAMEAERDSFKRELQVQVQASESLKADNTKLYEKVRYLQNFSGTAGNRGGSAFNKRGVNDRDLDLEALEQRYEASVDPFRQFGRAERQRKLKEMPPMERVVFVVAKTVLGTKAMRTALFIYVTCLHLLVFITTAHWSHSDSCSPSDHEHLAHLPPVVAEAAKTLRNGG